MRDGRLGRNPADGIRLPRIRPKKHPYLTHAQLHELAALCGSEGLVVLFLGYTGLRWGELAALECSNVDFDRRRVQVDRAVVELTDGRLVYGSPKNHQQRSVPFPSFLTDQLRALVASEKSRDLVFTSPYGRPLRSATGSARPSTKRRTLSLTTTRTCCARRSTTSATRPRASPSRQVPTSRPCNGCSATPRRQ